MPDIDHFLGARSPPPSPADIYALPFGTLASSLPSEGSGGKGGETEFCCPLDWLVLFKEGAAGGMGEL